MAAGKNHASAGLAGLETLDGGQILLNSLKNWSGFSGTRPDAMAYFRTKYFIWGRQKEHSKSKLKEKAETLLRLTGLENLEKLIRTSYQEE